MLAARDQVLTDLVGEQDAAEGSELSSVDQHSADSATDVADREGFLSVAEMLEGELAEIDAAFERLEAGTYGLCEVDGKPIEEERLEALPATRRCTAHQQLADLE